MNQAYPHHPPQGPQASHQAAAHPGSGHTPGSQGCSAQTSGAQNVQHWNAPAPAERQHDHLGPAGTEYYGPETAYPAAYNGDARSWFDFSNSCYLKGFLIGAGATLLLTNPAVQKALVRGTVKVWSLVQGGVEEVKEQFRDVKAEMSQEE